MNNDSFDLEKKNILKNLNQDCFISGLYNTKTNLSFGHYVISGINTHGDQVIGYVVQIRKKWGAFGSDTFFIRERDGSLSTHENQSFWRLTEKQVDLVKPYFKYTPSEEKKNNPLLEYTIVDKYKECGFIINGNNAPSRVDSCSFSITVSS